MNVKCPLCGYEFDKGEPQAKGICSSCSFAKACKVTCCPNCGYQIQAESSIVNFFRGIFRRRR